MYPQVERCICSHILYQIGQRIPLYLHTERVPGRAGSGSGIDTYSVVHKIRRKSRILDLMVFQASRELMDDGSNHLQVSQLFCTYMIVDKTPGITHPDGIRWGRGR